MINNDYMGCDFYQNQAKNVESNGFVTFFDETTAKYYFAFVNEKTGKVIFRSEGYPTAAAQKTGLNSVVKNMTDEKRFSVLAEGKSFFVILKAKNSVEIARSCPFTNKVEAQNVINELTGKAIVEVAKKATPEVKVAAKKEVIAAVIPAKTTKKEVVAPAPVVAVKKEVTAKKVAISAKITTDALVFAANNEYLGHETLTDEYGKTGYALFTNTDNKHYFVVYNADSSVFQRSIGFTSEKERNTTFTTLKNAILNENAYKITSVENNFFVQIVDNQDNVLTCSESFTTFTEAFLRTPKGWAAPVEMVGTMY
jgi:uncharacterized protein YegP (UPF0339 family)